MNRLLLIFILAICYTRSSAQADSTVVYLHQSGRTTTADSSYYYLVFKKTDSSWYGKTYYKKRQTLYTEGNYLDVFPNRQNGSFNYYAINGLLEQNIIYADGQRMEMTWYYPNGNKKAWVSLRKGTDNPQQKAWRENRSVNPNYTVYREVSFDGGKAAWLKYLSKNLRADVATRSGMSKGVYTVVVDFAILPHGGVAQVTPVTYPENCNACVVEAIRIVQSSPYWQPAILNNEAIMTHQRQKISFVVE